MIIFHDDPAPATDGEGEGGDDVSASAAE